MNTARNVIPFPAQKPRAVPVFSCDPRHAGLRFARTEIEAFRGPDYAGWLYMSKRAPLWKRMVRAIAEGMR